MKPNERESDREEKIIRASTYGTTVVAASPFIALATAVARQVVKGDSFSKALLDRENILRSLEPGVWGRVAARRALLSPTVGEGVKIASEVFDKVSPVEKAVIYSSLSAMAGHLEARLVVRDETILSFRERGAELKPDLVQKSVSAAMWPATMRSSFSAAALFAAKEVIKNIKEKNGGQEINKSTAMAIGFACGAVGGVLSIPPNIAAIKAMETGKIPTMKEVMAEGIIAKGLKPRALLYGIIVGQMTMADLMAEYIKDLRKSNSTSQTPSSILKVDSNKLLKAENQEIKK